MTMMPDPVPLAGADPLDNPLAFAVSERDRSILNEVRDAVAGGRVRLAYQPVVRNPGGETAFYEGLARVLDRQGRVLPARHFMGAIEQHETGRMLDCASLQLGLEALARHPGLRISVNMSARSIGYRRWMQALDRGLAIDPTIGSRLILEITEASAMLMPDVVTAFMAEVHARGIVFALDDFGSGYTSFRYLRDFAFDILKIDGEFIRGIADNPDNQVLTEALVAIGQHFGMLTVAEGVEDRRDAAFLARIGIDLVQGHFFGTPSLKPTFMKNIVAAPRH